MAESVKDAVDGRVVVGRASSQEKESKEDRKDKTMKEEGESKTCYGIHSGK